MNYWMMPGASDEWYTPRYVFDAMAVEFDQDVAAPAGTRTHVPAMSFITRDSLQVPWIGFVWCNPPFGGRNGLVPWIEKFFTHGNGVLLTPDRTSVPWWQDAARRSDARLFVAGKIRFLRPDGTQGKSPGDGTTLFAAGPRGVNALRQAATAGLGFMEN